MTHTQSPMTSDKVHVPYGMIVTQLLQASRAQRPKIAESYGRLPKSVAEIHDAYAVGVTGPRQSGKTHFVEEAWAEDPEGTFVILPDRPLCESMHDNLMRKRAGSIVQIQHQIITVHQMLTAIKAHAGDLSNDRTQWTIEVRASDPDPSVTIANIVEEYKRRRDELLLHEVPSNHPLCKVKTIIVDGMLDGDRYGLNFARLVRFGQLGGQCPEYILMN